MSIAIYREGEYYKGDIVNGRIYLDNTNSFPEIKFSEFGTTITEDVLESIQGLGYYKTEKGFQIFDKSNETYVEENLPVYVEVFGVPKKTHKYTIVKEPSKEALKAAQLMLEGLMKELPAIKIKQDAFKLMEKIEAGKGIAYVYCRYGILIKLLDHIPGAQILISPDSDAYIVGTKAKTDELELKVPQRYVGKTIGKSGINIKCAARELGAKFIKVIPL